MTDVRVRAPEVLRHAFGMLLSLDNITMRLSHGPHTCYPRITSPLHAFSMLLSLDNITMHLSHGPHICYSQIISPLYVNLFETSVEH